jgi:hypothetical protein
MFSFLPSKHSKIQFAHFSCSISRCNLHIFQALKEILKINSFISFFNASHFIFLAAFSRARIKSTNIKRNKIVRENRKYFQIFPSHAHIEIQQQSTEQHTIYYAEPRIVKEDQRRQCITRKRPPRRQTHTYN